MSEYMKRRRKKRARKKLMKKTAIGVVIAILLVVLALFLIPQVLYKLGGEEEETIETSTIETQFSTEAEETTTAKTEEETTENRETVSQNQNSETLNFPISLEDGRLEIESVFAFDGINPDCNNQEGKNIATITLKNLSDTYLETAKISITTESGSTLNFFVQDLPAGKTVLAFSIENASLGKNVKYVDVNSNAVFTEGASVKEDFVSLSTEGTMVTLKNNSDTNLKDIVVYCHASLGDQLFGGIAYTYEISELPKYETATVDSVDCFLGLTEVVRIEVNEG